MATIYVLGIKEKKMKTNGNKNEKKKNDCKWVICLKKKLCSNEYIRLANFEDFWKTNFMQNIFGLMTCVQ